MKGICLHEHKIDHIAHLGPSAAAGIGTLLNLPAETIYQAVQQALHVTTTTRQSRKGEISSWKAYAPAFAGKMAIEAVDRVLRGEGAPSPAWEGEDGFIAYLLGGPKAQYIVPLPEKGEPKRAILDTYTKEHSAEYQSQALIDLARRMGPKIGDLSKIESIVIHTSHHTPLCDRQPAPTIRRRWTRRRAARPSTIPSCTSSPSRWKTGAGTTQRPTHRNAPTAQTPSRFGTRSRRWKILNGRGVITATIRKRRHSAAAVVVTLKGGSIISDELRGGRCASARCAARSSARITSRSSAPCRTA